MQFSSCHRTIVATIVLANLASFLPLWIAYRGWPELGKVEAIYGLAARIPVAILMFIAMAANWGTHYELGPPGFPQMNLVSKWFVIGLLPQLSLWIAFTVIVGSLFGSAALFFQKNRQISELDPKVRPPEDEARTVVVASSGSRGWSQNPRFGAFRAVPCVPGLRAFFSRSALLE